MSQTITEYIQHDLRQRIQTGAPLPERFTLQQLAHHYSVSLTPVRLALRHLIDQGVIQKGANGRLVPVLPQKNQKKVKPNASPIRPPKDWHAELVAFVLKASLSTGSKFLREETIAEQFGIGRTIVRQSFGRFAGAGLLDHVPRRGWKVVPFQEKDLRDYVQVRELLERQAFNLAIPHLCHLQLQQMLTQNQPDAHGKTQIDNRLHQYFIDCAGNRYIKDYFRVFGGYFSTLFDYATFGEQVVQQMAEQHCHILQAALNQQWPAAEDYLVLHIRAQIPILQSYLAKIAATHLT